MPIKPSPQPGDEYALDIFHDIVRVKFCEGMAHTDGSTCWGWFDSTGRTIEISNTDPQRMRQTLLHEFFHACVGVMHGRGSLEGVSDPEEMFVRACESGIVHLYRMPCNKWAVDYLFGGKL